MDYFTVLLALLLCSTSFLLGLLLWSRRSANSSDRIRIIRPPGPRSLPIIGNLHQIRDLPYKSLAKLAETHGPIMRLTLGRKSAVVISSSEFAREVLQKQDLAFSSRFVPDALSAHRHSEFSVIWLDASGRWRSLRRIMTSNLFSVNKLTANRHLRSCKVRELIDYCEKCGKAGNTVDINQAALKTFFNSLSNTIFSKDLANDDSLKSFEDLIRNVKCEAGKPNLVDFFPIFKPFDPQGIRRRMSTYFGEILHLFGDLIDERLELRRLKKNDDDLLDTLLNISDENPQEIDTTHIQRMFLDLFFAGIDTSTSTIVWAMAELLRNPLTLNKLKFELQQIIGDGRIVEEDDLHHLPFLQCVVRETLRLHSTAPLILRKATKDTTVCGFSIQKGETVFLNAWAIGRDGTKWKDPLRFVPERFWDSEVDVRGHDFEVIPFGAGRRICPGMPLAMRMIPVVLGSLINCFDQWKIEGDLNPMEMNMDAKLGLTLHKAQPLLVVPVRSTMVLPSA